jgi:hypothetical protein
MPDYNVVVPGKLMFSIVAESEEAAIDRVSSVIQTVKRAHLEADWVIPSDDRATYSAELQEEVE